MVIYKTLLAVFGLGSTAPFRVVNVLLLLTVVALVFAYVRVRLGDVMALIIGCVLLFLGPSWENLLWPAGISFLGALAAGLGALLALQRESGRGDVVACALLVVATAFSGLGLVFAIGAAVEVALGDRRRIERVPIAGIPVLLYALWYATYGHEAEATASLDNLLAAPTYVWDAASAATASLFGLTGITAGSLGVDPDLGRPLLVAALLLALWLVVRDPPVRSPRLWAVLASALAFWGLAALNYTPGREAGASRYQLVGAVLLVLVFAELLRGRRLRGPWLWLAGVVAAAAIVSNIGALRAGEEFLRARSDANLAALAAIEGARSDVDPDAGLGPELPGTPFPQPTAASTYFAAHDRWGSPVPDPRAAVHGPELARRTADVLLASLLELRLEPLPAETATSPGCRAVEPDPESGAVVLELRPGGATIVSDSGLESVGLRRWSDADVPVDLGPAPPGAVALEVPRDDFADPWVAQLAGSRRSSVCPLGG